MHQKQQSTTYQSWYSRTTEEPGARKESVNDVLGTAMSQRKVTTSNYIGQKLL